MKPLGATIIALGIASLFIGFVGLRFRVLWLLDEFGPFIAYPLKIGVILLGVWIYRHAEPAAVEDRERDDPEPNKSAWVRVALSLVFVFGIAVFITVRVLMDMRLDRQLNRPAPPAAWASLPPEKWPALVLRQHAEFKHHTAMDAGCACLIRLPSGDVVALTAGHLLGDAGGVQPGFTSVAGLNPKKLATLDGEIVSWKLYPPDHEEQSASAAGLFGPADRFSVDCDQVLLRLSKPPGDYPMPPLEIRLKPVSYEEDLYAILITFDDEGNQRQTVLPAKRIPGLTFTCHLARPTDLTACSGAPVVDKDGFLVAIATGGTLMDLGSNSSVVRAFSGHSIGELAPVMKAALTRKPPAKVAARQ